MSTYENSLEAKIKKGFEPLPESVDEIKA